MFAQKLRNRQNEALAFLKKLTLDEDAARKQIHILDDEQLVCLINCYRYGLRGHHLRQWENRINRFITSHASRIEYELAFNKNSTPASAIKEINCLTEIEAKRRRCCSL